MSCLNVCNLIIRKQLKHWERSRSRKTTHLLDIAFIHLCELGLIAMMAVLYDISFAVEKAHDKMLDLSKCEKTKQIVKNVLDMVRAYIAKASLVGKTFRVVKQGASAIY